MSLLNIRSWSLTRRLSIFFAVTMGIILLIIFAVLFNGLVIQLKKKNEQDLRNILQIQEGVIQTIHNERRPNVWQQHWFENFDPDARLFLRITAPDGSLYAESQNMPIPAEDFPEPSEKFSYTVWVKHHKNGRITKMYLASKSVEVKGHKRWLIQTALNVTQERAILESSFDILKIIILVALVITTFAGWLITRQGLKPLGVLNNEIQKINAEQLDIRIGNQQWPEELKNLADSFDNMLARLETSFTELSRFSSDIAHEFRSPINNMIAAATVIQSQERSAEEYKNTLAMITEEAERLARMISSMLFLARADKATQAIHRESVTTETIFKQLQEFFEIAAEERHIALTFTGNERLFVDITLILRALSNLLDNAIRHTPNGGRITLTALRQNDNVLISIADTGEGISREHLPHIFERFYCVDKSRTENESTGLGLAIVKSIAELHGGSVIVESEQGKGSKFTLIIVDKN